MDHYQWSEHSVMGQWERNQRELERQEKESLASGKRYIERVQAEERAFRNARDGQGRSVTQEQTREEKSFWQWVKECFS